MKLLILAAGLLLAACGGEPDREAAQQAEDRETVFDPLTGQMDEAKAVNETVQQRKDDIDAALRETEETDEP